MSLKRHNFYPGDIPTKPGCYIYRDIFGKVIYVGKATNLRRRMSQYFQPSREHRADPKLRSLINTIETWEFITVRNEDEALVLETHLIKEYAPHFNILMRDDKRHLMLKIDPAEKFPRLKMARLKKDDSCLYFGPFPKGGALKMTAEFLVHYLKLRTCKVAEPGLQDRKHCLAGSIRDCCRPCEGKVTEEEYQARIDKLIAILNGDIKEVRDVLKLKMKEVAEKQQFEKAALYRDVSANIESLYARKIRTFENAELPDSAPGPASVVDLQNALKLKELPNNIECFDISNISGTLAVASLVHFTNGTPDKAKYRRFRIRTVTGSNDFAMMKEAVSRHFTNLLEKKLPLPDLLMVDGGKGQISSAIEALIEVKCPPLPLIGLAERNEEIYVPGRSTPYVLPRSSRALKLLQAVRDEAHRFAITYHRNLRLDAIRNSILDEIPGIGEARKTAILKEFGSVRSLRRAPSPKAIADRVPGIGIEFATIIFDYLKKHQPDGKVNPL